MKLAIVLAAVCALVAAAFSAAVPAASPAARANFGIGGINVNDRLLYRAYVSRNPIANAVQYEDVIYRGNATTRITAIYATEEGYTQYASAWLIAGGLNQTTATVRHQSQAGRGYFYRTEFYGQ